MKSRLVIATICLVLVLAVLSLAVWTQGGSGLFRSAYGAPECKEPDIGSYHACISACDSIDNLIKRLECGNKCRETWAKQQAEYYDCRAKSRQTTTTKPPTTPAVSAAEENQARLDAAIKAKDVNAIVEAMKFAKSGRIPEPAATRQWEQGQQALGNINQERLDAAIKAKDVNAIAEAMKFAAGGLVPTEQGGKQEKQGQQALGNINQERLDAAIKAKDVNAIVEAMKFAASGLVPAEQGGNQEKQAQEALANLGVLTVTPSVKSTEGAKLTAASGEVQVRKGGAGEWTKDSQTILKSGDKVRTGENGKVTMEYTDGYEITLGPTTSVDIVDLDKEIDLLVGKIFGKVKKYVMGLKCRLEVRTPSACCCVRGTEFTVSVDKDGTTTWMVLEGFIVVTDLASNNGVTLAPRQMVTIPNVPGGLTQQDMLGRVQVFWPEKIDRWWEKAPAAAGKQAAQNLWGIVFVVLAVAAIIFLVAGQVFALLLRRRYGRSPG